MMRQSGKSPCLLLQDLKGEEGQSQHSTPDYDGKAPTTLMDQPQAETSFFSRSILEPTQLLHVFFFVFFSCLELDIG